METRVTIVDVKIPFWSMVVLMVKWVIASIPAFFILLALGTAAASMLGLLGGILRGMH